MGISECLSQKGFLYTKYQIKFTNVKHTRKLHDFLLLCKDIYNSSSETLRNANSKIV